MSFVQPPALDSTSPAQPAQHDAIAQQIRGSSLLLIGKALALGLDFGSGVLLVRYLSKADYGALSYALSITTFFQGLATFELANTLARFVPLYRERNQHNTMLGSIVLAFGFVTGLGALMAVAIGVGLALFGLKPIADPQALRLLIVVAVLIPVQGIDGLFTTLFAIFGESRTIVLRQSILAPGLKLVLVVTLITLRANVTFLALGYAAMGIIGVMLYAGMFGRVLRTHGLLQGVAPRRLSYPVRELFGFATPMLASRLTLLVRESSDVFLLGYFQGTAMVANYRAVLPVAELNQLVILAFTVLYTPLAARLYARNDRAELSRLYGQTALWMTMLSFPIFVLTFSFARSTTLGIYGSRYSDAAPSLALLSLGYFFHTSLGFNGLTLKIFRRMRYTVSIDVAAAALNVAINLLLIPRWGALGAAVGTAGTMIVHNVLKEFGLWKYTGITLFHREHVLAYSMLFGLPLVLLALPRLLPLPLWVALPVAVAVSLLVLWSNRNILQIDAMFPELRRWPIVHTIWRWLARAS